MATEPRYAEVLAHLEEDEEARLAAQTARAAAREEMAGRAAAARGPGGDSLTGAMGGI